MNTVEEKLTQKFLKCPKDINRSMIDFKEVYKWVVSPKLAKYLNVPPNLEGSFLINLTFACKQKNTQSSLQEEQILVQL